MRKIIVVLIFATPAAWSGEWKVDDAGPSISQDAGNTIKDESWSNDVTPRMHFSCEDGGDIIARIDWQRFISSFNTEVGFKVDGSKFTWLKWKIDSSERVTISPSASDTQKLLDAIGRGNELLVEVTPYSESPVTATFELTDLAGSIERLRADCQ